MSEICERPIRYPSMARIAGALRPISQASGLPIDEITGGGRGRSSVVVARHAGLIRCRQLWPEASVTRLARCFGVHHATAICAINRVTENKALRESIDDLLEASTEQSSERSAS